MPAQHSFVFGLQWPLEGACRVLRAALAHPIWRSNEKCNLNSKQISKSRLEIFFWGPMKQVAFAGLCVLPGKRPPTFAFEKKVQPPAGHRTGLGVQLMPRRDLPCILLSPAPPPAGGGGKKAILLEERTGGSLSPQIALSLELGRQMAVGCKNQSAGVKRRADLSKEKRRQQVHSHSQKPIQRKKREHCPSPCPFDFFFLQGGTEDNNHAQGLL